jgi:DNA-binding NarL/FixJ family response regulator
MTGLQLVIQLRQRFPNVCLIIATIHDEHSLMESAFANSCNAFLVKPHGFMELFKRLNTSNMQDFFADSLVIDQYGPRPFQMAYT